MNFFFIVICSNCKRQKTLSMDVWRNASNELLPALFFPMSIVESKYKPESKSRKNISKSYNNYDLCFNNIKFSMGRVGFEPTTPAMSRRYLNQARPPALVLRLLIFFLLFIYNCSLFSSSLEGEGLSWFLKPFETSVSFLLSPWLWTYLEFLLFLVRSSNLLSLFWILLNLVSSRLGNKEQIKFPSN